MQCLRGKLKRFDLIAYNSERTQMAAETVYKIWFLFRTHCYLQNPWQTFLLFEIVFLEKEFCFNAFLKFIFFCIFLNNFLCNSLQMMRVLTNSEVWLAEGGSLVDIAPLKHLLAKFSVWHAQQTLAILGWSVHPPLLAMFVVNVPQAWLAMVNYVNLSLPVLMNRAFLQ